MRSAALPAALVAASLGLALASAPIRAAQLSAATFAVMAVAVFMIPMQTLEPDAAFLGCFVVVVVSGVAVAWPNRFTTARTIPLAALSGALVGAVVSTSGVAVELFALLPLILVAFPARWIVGSGKGIALKVVASWLIAVSLLAGALILAPITPGYEPDHIE